MIPLNRALLWTACAVILFGASSDILAQAVAPAGSASEANTQAQQNNSAPQSDSGNSSAPANPPATIPDSPSASQSSTQDATPPGEDNGNKQQSPATGTAQNPKLQRPVGTAAAAAPKVNGVTAAQPAGVAIAPAKQHRVRTIVIRTGAILGAGAALGAVVALTAGTPSKPPGAH